MQVGGESQGDLGSYIYALLEERRGRPCGVMYSVVYPQRSTIYRKPCSCRGHSVFILSCHEAAPGTELQDTIKMNFGIR